MRVNEVLSRVEDSEVICLNLNYYGIMGYKNEIKRDCRFVNEHIGDWLVTDICIQEMNKIHVLAVTACRPQKEGEIMKLVTLLPLMLNDTVVNMELTYRDDENILTRQSAVRKVKDIKSFFKENDLHIYEFDVTSISPIVKEDLIMIQIILRRCS